MAGSKTVEGAEKMSNEIILVDEQDQVVGYGEKMEIHQKKILHRAFSIFIYDRKKNKMLLQRRADNKYHSGGLWTNACCSHPRRSEPMEECLRNRLKEELGLDIRFRISDPGDSVLLINDIDVIYYCGKFQYYSSFGEIGEHEIDHVFLYSPVINSFDNLQIKFDPEEVSEIKWVTIDELQTWCRNKPEEFTVWFKPAYDIAYKILCRQAGDLDKFL